MDKKAFVNDLSGRMDKALLMLENELKGLRAGRASVHLLDAIEADIYGNRMHISQLATISTPDARLIHVQVWDKSSVKSVEKAIVEANLGLTPLTDGQVIRLSIPPLSEDRRRELVKLAGKYGENTKISVRNIRRDGMEQLKKLEKDTEISKDEHYGLGEDVQKLTDGFISKIDKMTTQKEQEIMTI